MELTSILLPALAAAAGGAVSYIRAVYASIIRNGHFLKKFWSEISVSTLAGVVVSLIAGNELDTHLMLSLVFLVGFSTSQLIQDLRQKITEQLEQKLVEKLEGEKKNEP